ncbi:MAG: hypothetical protein KO253_04550 [Methanobrevibacter arboriphilus]|nr:hypothetical protein [Methanobrevibacter arboriphilus]
MNKVSKKSLIDYAIAIQLEKIEKIENSATISASIKLAETLEAPMSNLIELLKLKN